QGLDDLVAVRDSEGAQLPEANAKEAQEKKAAARCADELHLLQDVSKRGWLSVLIGRDAHSVFLNLELDIKLVPRFAQGADGRLVLVDFGSSHIELDGSHSELFRPFDRLLGFVLQVFLVCDKTLNSSVGFCRLGSSFLLELFAHRLLSFVPALLANFVQLL